MNVMRNILVDKVTVNIGVGSPGDRLEYAKELLSRLTGRQPVETTAKRREPVFKLRKGLPIGAKVTLRGSDARGFLDKALSANRRVLKAGNFDRLGNFSFGVAEYIDFPGAKYNPEAGMFGFDVCVTLKRKGERVCRRKIRRGRVGKRHRIAAEEAIEFARKELAAKIEE